jgi:carboxyl-terminal processing protease
MPNRDPQKNFESLWKTFNDRYPFFELRHVDWNAQYARYRPQITRGTSDDELFETLCEMLRPLNDGHVELMANTKTGPEKRYFRAERTPRFYQEFNKKEIKQLFQTTAKTLAAHGFGRPEKTAAWMIRYCRSSEFGYMRILELEGIKKQKLKAALNKIGRDLRDLKGIIIDIRDNPGGDDDTVIAIADRFCDRKRAAFCRKTKIGPGKDDFTPLKTWYMEPKGDTHFTGPIVLLTCDSVFSGGEVFALAMKQLPNIKIIGDHTNGIFSYQLEKKLPNGWLYCLSYQVYMSPDMQCYEGRGVTPDIRMLNRKSDIQNKIDPLITRAIETLRSANAAGEQLYPPTDPFGRGHPDLKEVNGPDAKR